MTCLIDSVRPFGLHFVCSFAQFFKESVFCRYVFLGGIVCNLFHDLRQHFIRWFFVGEETIGIQFSF